MKSLSLGLTDESKDHFSHICDDSNQDPVSNTFSSSWIINCRLHHLAGALPKDLTTLDTNPVDHGDHLDELPKVGNGKTYSAFADKLPVFLAPSDKMDDQIRSLPWR
jgi:hypothetical protein